MLQIGIQSKNIIDDKKPEEGFLALKKAGFACIDFSLNEYLKNTDLHQLKVNSFFNQSLEGLINYFEPIKNAAETNGIKINQMHMPYPIYIPHGTEEINKFLLEEMVYKSLKICSYFNCPYIVIHGFKLKKYLGSEEGEWKKTKEFLHSIAPMAIELGITLCIENLYTCVGGHILEGPCCNVRKVVERIDEFNTNYGIEVLGFCFDTGHANLVGINFEDFIVTLGERLKVLHIHDNDGIGDLHQIPFTFTKTRENKATTDWEGFVRGLKAIGYDNVLSFETGPVLNSFPKELKYDVLEFISKIGKHFVSELMSENEIIFRG